VRVQIASVNTLKRVRWRGRAASVTPSSVQQAETKRSYPRERRENVSMMEREIHTYGSSIQTTLPDVLFVSGAGHTAACWDYLLPLFIEANIRVHTLNFRGHGEGQDKETVRFNRLQDYVDDVRTALGDTRGGHGEVAAIDHERERADQEHPARERHLPLHGAYALQGDGEAPERNRHRRGDRGGGLIAERLYGQRADLLLESCALRRGGAGAGGAR